MPAFFIAKRSTKVYNKGKRSTKVYNEEVGKGEPVMISKNPFDTSFSTIPEAYVYTPEVKKTVRDVLMSSSAKAYFIGGLRGSGKTVMMNRIVNELEQFQDDEVVFKRVLLIDGPEMIASLAQQLTNILHKSDHKLSSVSLSVAAFGSVSATWKDAGMDVLQPKIIDLLQLLAAKHVHIVVTIDEVNDTPAIRQFAPLFNAIKSLDLPMTVLMTGLPDLIDRIKNRKNLTFLYRATRIQTGFLDLFAMANEYRKWLHCTLSFANYLARLADGYSYAFQILGSLVFVKFNGNFDSVTWNKGVIDELLDDYRSMLYNGAYAKIYLEEPQQEREYLKCIDGKRHLMDIARRLGWDKGLTSRYRSILIKKKLIKSTGYGLVNFTLPLFGDFVKEASDPNSLEYIG